jgi:hypothetical protein
VASAAQSASGSEQAIEELRKLREELGKLRDENKQLEAWLAEAEERAKQTAGQVSSPIELDDLMRRLEMAMQDVRELTSKNYELTEQLARAKAAGPVLVDAGGMDWESQKRRMLEQLNADFDESDEQQKADKLTVEKAIRATENAVAEKEMEIQELRKLLDNQSQNVGEVAVGASIIAQALDSDEIIRQERDSLKELQVKLREELRKAEVDCSLERAKIARERAELEEKLRQFEQERESMAHVEPGVGGDKSKKGSGRGKWLARLGLGADGKE